MSCIKCKQRPATCDDYCVECEIEFHLENPDENDDLIESYHNNPEWFKAWAPVVAEIERLRRES